MEEVEATIMQEENKTNQNKKDEKINLRIFTSRKGTGVQRDGITIFEVNCIKFFNSAKPDQEKYQT